MGDAAGNVHVWNLSSENHQSILHEKDSSIQSVDIDAAGNMISAITNKGTCYMSTFPIRWAIQHSMLYQNMTQKNSK